MLKLKFWALIYSKRLVFAQGLCTGTQLVNQAYVLFIFQAWGLALRLLR